MGVYGSGFNGIEGDGVGYGAALRGGTAAVYLGPNGGPPPESAAPHLYGEVTMDEGGSLWACVQDGTPGTWRRLADRTSAGLFHPIAPTRVFDSRRPKPSPGVLRGGRSKIVSVASARSLTTGDATLTLVPAGARAVALSVSVVDTRGSGEITVVPGDHTASQGTTVSWWGRGQRSTSSTTCPLDSRRRVRLICTGSGARTHVTVDVTGWYE